MQIDHVRMLVVQADNLPSGIYSLVLTAVTFVSVPALHLRHVLLFTSDKSTGSWEVRWQQQRGKRHSPLGKPVAR